MVSLTIRQPTTHMHIRLVSILVPLFAIAFLGMIMTAEAKPTVTKAPFGKTAEGQQVDIYMLTNSKGAEARIINYGGALVSLKVPDKNGKLGDVVLGYDLLLNRDVAIKIFRSRSGMPDDEERFDREARVLASLSHPNLVTVFDAGIDTNNAQPGGPYLVMEYVAGPTVADVIADGPVDSTKVAVLGAQVAAHNMVCEQRDRWPHLLISQF